MLGGRTSCLTFCSARLGARLPTGIGWKAKIPVCVACRCKGVQDVMVELAHERVRVTFDARKTHAPDLHEAILKSGYKPGPRAD